jgi:hypothetical protein
VLASADRGPAQWVAVALRDQGDQLGQADEVIGRDRQREHPPDAGEATVLATTAGARHRRISDGSSGIRTADALLSRFAHARRLRRDSYTNYS